MPSSLFASFAEPVLAMLERQDGKINRKFANAAGLRQAVHRQTKKTQPRLRFF
jgi:hypothetical protein